MSMIPLLFIKGRHDRRNNNNRKSRSRSRSPNDNIWEKEREKNARKRLKMKKKVATLAEATLNDDFDRWDHDDFFVNYKKQLDADDFGPICPPHLLDNPDGVGTSSRWRKRRQAERIGPDVWTTSDDESEKKRKKEI